MEPPSATAQARSFTKEVLVSPLDLFITYFSALIVTSLSSEGLLVYEKLQ
jgi:hypothetical protein